MKSWLDTINSKGIINPCIETKVEPRGYAGVFYLLKFFKMSEIYLKCQYNDKDKMIVSKGDHICFEVYEGEGASRTICLDEKQIFTLIKFIETFRDERLD